MSQIANKDFKIPELQLEGRSGCDIEVIRGVEHFIVRKSSSGKGYDARLLKQAEKQAGFRSNVHLTHFAVPEVYAMSKEGESPTWFEMQFIHAEKYSDYLERASIHEINSIYSHFIEYFNNLIDSATLSDPPLEIINSKRADLEMKLHTEGQHGTVLQALSFLENLPDEQILLGNCHGDFTLSNMLFANDRIYLVDFLDSFVESPVIDIVKLRQDTAFGWTLLIEEGLPEFRANKIRLVLEHWDNKLKEFIKSQPVIDRWYRVFQVFNLLRILPYVHKETEKNFITTSLQKILVQ